MAIESIRDKVFTTKSDVWSFGVLLWEFFTLGSTPYPGMEFDEEFYIKLNSGYRMAQPKYCPNFIYRDIMAKCWLKDPNLRPEFSQLSANLGDLLESSVRQHYLDLNDPYQEMNNILFSNHDYLNMKSTDGAEYGEDYVAMDEGTIAGQRSSTPIDCDLIMSVNGTNPDAKGPIIQLDSYPDLSRTHGGPNWWN